VRAARGGRLLLGLALFIGSSVAVISAPAPVAAHQPVVVDSETTGVTDPEISKAYYATLVGEPQRYLIDSPVAFDLYVGILVPDDGSPVKDVAAEIFQGDELLARLGGVEAAWSTFYEPFGQNTYYDGGEYRLRAAPGVYSVVVSSIDNTSSYSLAIGEIESFDAEAILRTFAVMPTLQQELFGVSTLGFAGSWFGLLSLAIIAAAALLTALCYRALLRWQRLRLIVGRSWPISRGVRGVAALLLLSAALSIPWNPLLLFASGLLLFDVLLGRRDTV
jgi:hypothetical protein